MGNVRLFLIDQKLRYTKAQSPFHIDGLTGDIGRSEINRPPKRDSAIGAVTEKTRVVRLVKRRHLFLYAGMNDTERRGPVVVLSNLVVVGNSVVLAARTHLLPQSHDLVGPCRRQCRMSLVVGKHTEERRGGEGG